MNVHTVVHQKLIDLTDVELQVVAPFHFIKKKVIYSLESGRPTF